MENTRGQNCFSVSENVHRTNTKALKHVNSIALRCVAVCEWYLCLCKRERFLFIFPGVDSFCSSYLYDVHKSFGKCTVEWKCHAITHETIYFALFYLWIAAKAYRILPAKERNIQYSYANNNHMEYTIPISNIHRPLTNRHTRTSNIEHTHTKTESEERSVNFSFCITLLRIKCQTQNETHSECQKQKQNSHMPYVHTLPNGTSNRYVQFKWNIMVNRKQRESNIVTYIMRHNRNQLEFFALNATCSMLTVLTESESEHLL